MDRTMSLRLLPLVAALVAIATTAPILRIYFIADDFDYLYRFANYGPALPVLAAPQGGHLCLVRNVIFYLTFRLFGMHAAWYFATVLITHVANVLLLYALVRRLTGSTLLACFGAVLFAVGPANIGTLGWYSASCHATAAAFVLVALLLLAPRVDGSPSIGMPAAAAVSACMLAASQCFGTGTAAALLLPVLALLLRPSVVHTRGVALVFMAVPVLVAAVYRAVWSIPSPYVNAATYNWIVAAATTWDLVLSTAGHLLVAGTVDLVLGAAYPLGRYPDAVAVGTFAVCVLTVGWALVRGSSRTRRGIVAFLALAIASVGSVAAGRAVLVSTMVKPGNLPHMMAISARYQYLAQIALAVVVSLVLAEVGRRVAWSTVTRMLLLAGWSTWALGSALLFRSPVNAYDPQRAEVASLRDAMIAEIHTQPSGSVVCLANRSAPLAMFFPGTVGVFMLFERENVVDGRRVYFVSSDAKLLAQREAGTRLESLLLPAGACPPSGG
jgi:hypothetical protein